MKFFSRLLLLLTMSMIVALDALVVYLTSWPFWTFVTNIGIILLVLILFFQLKKLFLKFRLTRKHRKNFNSSSNEKAIIDTQLKGLRRDWCDGIGRFSKQSLWSWLKAKQDVPIFLLLGASSSGKTSLIGNSQIATRLKVSSHNKEDVEKVYTINYWGLPRGFVVDIPGAIVEQTNLASRSIWKALLNLIQETNRKYLVNGVVVCVDVQSLMLCHGDELVLQGKKIRLRLDELANTFGLNIPIYICITKCDKIEGMTEFFSYTMMKNMTQVFGQLFSRNHIGKKAKYLISIAFKNIHLSLNMLRLKLLSEYDLPGKGRRGVFFPEEMAAIKNSLQAYLEPIFLPDGSQNVPMFRALYFTSAEQGGTQYSYARKRYALGEARQEISVGNGSYFIRDMFGIVLPNENSLASFTLKAVKLQSLVDRVGVTLWLGLFLSLAVMLTLSYNKNAEVMERSNILTTENNIIDTKLPNGIYDIDKLRHSIENIESNWDNKWFSYLGMTQSRVVLGKMKEKFVADVKDVLLAREDKYLDRSLELVTDVKAPKLTAAYVNFIVKKIGLLTYAIDNLGVKFSEHDIDDNNFPDFSVVNKEVTSLSVNEYNALMLSNYISYLRWQPRLTELKSERDKANKRLEILYEANDSNLAWVIDWANHEASIPEVNATDIWAREVKLQDRSSITVAPAFTTEGQAAIDKFLDNIQSASADQKRFERQRELFSKNYAALYFDSWLGMLKNFEKGAKAWSENGKLTDLAKLVSTENSPYTRFISILVENIRSVLPKAVAYNVTTPAWVHLLLQIDELQHSLLVRQDQKSNDLSRYAIIAKRKFERIDDDIRNIGSDPVIRNATGKHKKTIDLAKPYYKEYFSTLGELGEILKGRAASYDLVKVVFNESDMSIESAKNLIAKNNKSLLKLKEILSNQTNNEDLVWKLLNDQTNIMWRVLLIESRKYIQQQWEQDVLTSVSDFRDWEMLEKFRGENGSLWKFQEFLVNPFLDRRKVSRYNEKKVYNESIGFSEGFMRSINTQKIGKDTLSNNYQIRISALPTDTNKYALVKPHETKISFKCQNGTQILVNQNYPVSKIVNWSPTLCTEISLNIYLGSVVLEKKYRGARETMEFFSDYKNGKRVFRKDEFGDKKKILTQYNVDTISVGYVLSGYDNIQKLGDILGLLVPKKIISEDVLM